MLGLGNHIHKTYGKLFVVTSADLFKECQALNIICISSGCKCLALSCYILFCGVW